MGVIFRRAAKFDIEFIETLTDKIMTEYYTNNYNIDYLSDIKTNNFWLDKYNHLAYIAILDNKLIGSVKVILNNNFIKITELVIDEKFRGRGIGSKLLLFAEDDAIQKCISNEKHILLGSSKLPNFKTAAAIQSGNIPFFIKHGYSVNSISKRGSAVLSKTIAHHLYLTKSQDEIMEIIKS